ncbi:hypothetical protein [Rhodanobacter terrae]|uniref:UrcA family protein n=1 Tax=Rhodanobacter terrae TaxID=418647 RepID=A0ABW0SSD3_9GAMM
MPILTRLTLVAMVGGLLLTGCAEQKATRTTTTSTETSSATTSAAAAGNARQRRTPKGHIIVTDVNLPDRTGIPACDDYLSSYLACHRAAAIFAPNQLQSRYEAMRTSLLRDSENPDIRPQLAARCNSLASQLREALHGKSCAETPAPNSSGSGTP